MRTQTKVIRAVIVFTLAVAAVQACRAADPKENFYLHDGDRVLFYGDSITDQRLYTQFVEAYTLTRFPNLHIQFINSGWGGDRITGGGGGPIDLRLRRDVFEHHPTVVTIMLGMNDAGYQPFDAKLFDTYSTGYRHIVDTIKSTLPGVRITLIQPSPFDDVTRVPGFEGGYNGVLIRYGQFNKELAQEKHVDIADLNSSVVMALDQAKATDPDKAKEIIPDRVHPAPGGHLLMAEALLKAWRAPSLVSSVHVDAATGKVKRAENTTLTELKAVPLLSWTQTDKALPMPLNMSDPILALAVRSSDFIAALDQEQLRVTGLPAAKYVLRIDGEEVGDFSRQDLDTGINLAPLATPMAKQSARVMALTHRRGDLRYARWREVQVVLQEENLPDYQRVLEALDKLDAELVEKQRAAAQPVARHYELQPRSALALIPMRGDIN